MRKAALPSRSTVHDARVVRILLSAIELTSDERAAHLDETCDGDALLRADVERLLANEEAARVALPTPIAGTPMSAAHADDAVPERIGPYRIVRPIGEGGMGRVYLAEQLYPIKRVVALKLIRRGMDSQEVIARFHAERQSLALLNHRCIAQVYDAGEVEGFGHPYFVMEHVADAQPITEHCDRARLTIDQRLALFVDVCQAVHHAHERGVLHRDLKPSNVLVSVQDGRASPKVIDFGVATVIARASATLDPARGTTTVDQFNARFERRGNIGDDDIGDDDIADGVTRDQTLLTHPGRAIGTPRYMSPEQASAAAMLDARSDVYALGMILRELLIAPMPRGMRGDLDAIIAGATENDRNRRYPSASELEADLGRHRSGHPVGARRATIRYRASKFAGRHHRSLIVPAIALTPLIATYIYSTWRSAQSQQIENTAIRAHVSLDLNHTMSMLGSLAGSQIQTGHPEEAYATYANQFMPLAAQRYQPWDAEMLNFRMRLGSFEAGIKRFADGERSINGAVADGRAHGTIDPYAERRAAERLIELYDAWGKPDRAQDVRKQLPEIMCAIGRTMPDPQLESFIGEIFRRSNREVQRERLTDALRWLDFEALPLATSRYAAWDPRMVGITLRYASFVALVGRCQEAEDISLAAIAEAKSHHTFDAEMERDLCVRMIRLYEIWKRLDRVEDLKRQLSDLQLRAARSPRSATTTSPAALPKMTGDDTD